jgi:predicted RNA-binding Zn-ribbon protein involved in translation (DUF1610 family)
MRRTWLIGLTLVGLCGAVLVGVAWAATIYRLECLNAKCGYKGQCELGGLMRSDSIDGYCVACGKWVRLVWNRKDGKAPEPLGKVWVAETGKTLPVFACPNCKGPFTPVTEDDMVKESKYKVGQKVEPNDRFMHCPKCGEPSLKMKAEIFAD